MNFINRISRRRRINRAIRELTSLSDETLRDIGIERGNIAKLVETAIDAGGTVSRNRGETTNRLPETSAATA